MAYFYAAVWPDFAPPFTVHDVAKRLYDGLFEGNTAYLCGPPPMIEACIGALMQGRLFEKHIFTERFLTAKAGVEKPKSPLFRRV